MKTRFVTLPLQAQEINNGNSYASGHRFNAVADTNAVDIHMLTGTTAVNVVASVTVDGGPVDVEAFEAATISGNGTTKGILNRNRNSSNTAAAQVFHTPTISDDGTQLVDTLIPSTSGGAGANAFSLGGSANTDHENDKFILKPSTSYLIRVTNNSGGPIDVVITLNWYEE